MFQQYFSLPCHLKSVTLNPYYEQPGGTAGKLLEILIKECLVDLTIPYLALQ